ncbi:ABC transporter transmembrane domain-containing protein [Dactylosporangium matsuzakiense]|uniref:ABC transporter transmembrane domain-containing protein n=1 Tax=Dactylosporangium matsuzakiense TaxID=53360 RepID=UPI0021C2B75F|nr:ABC transporter ATP-binding protein [Dactylosporangium matsuzakiense]UWZ44295.1 ABC transporter ATP-binding protein [Dactylosporangium matsuzakiense]
MRRLPQDEPGEPDSRSAFRYLVWIVRGQLGLIAGGVTFGVLWMVSQALVPAAIGGGVDALARHDRGGLLRAGTAVLGLGAATAFTGIMRHRFAVSNFLSAGFRTVQVTARQATRLGAALQKRVAAGEVVSIGTTDFDHIGYSIDVTARASGSVVAIVVVTALLLRVSVPLGLVVVLGVPVLVVVVGVLLRPLHQRRRHQRELAGELTGRAADIVAGLRVLRGVGGEQEFSRRYRVESQRVRFAGVRVARVEATLEAAQILLPGCFIALVTWLGARFAVSGRISPGELVAFYAYAAFLIGPLRTLTEFAQKLTRGLVAAGRVVAVLRVEPDFSETAASVPVQEGDLDDPDSGLLVQEHRLTAVAAVRPQDAAAIAERLALLDPASNVRVRGVPLKAMALEEVRRRILLADNDAMLFRGPLRDEVGDGDTLADAAAVDIVEALPDGLDTEIAERGRDFSGGQQQRLRLARALALDPPVLVLVEPTSAVDAHTEARIAERLPQRRKGRTTVVCTTSPLLLDRADTVAFVGADGRVAATGPHRELLDSCPAYAATVTRGEG